MPKCNTLFKREMKSTKCADIDSYRYKGTTDTSLDPSNNRSACSVIEVAVCSALEAPKTSVSLGFWLVASTALSHQPEAPHPNKIIPAAYDFQPH